MSFRGLLVEDLYCSNLEQSVYYSFSVLRIETWSMVNPRIELLNPRFDHLCHVHCIYVSTISAKYQLSSVLI